MCHLDLKDDFLHVPIGKKSRKFLRFSFEGTLYEFSCLPFGLNISPYVFTNILKPVVNYLREKGQLSVIYLDDILVLGNSFDDCYQNLKTTIDLLKSLGFLINYEKSDLKPSKICPYLGFLFNSTNLSVELPHDKRTNLRCLVEKFMKKQICTIREFAQLIGRLVASCPAVAYGMVHTKSLERAKFLAITLSEGDFNDHMSVPHSVISDLSWWKNMLPNAINPIRQFSFVKEIFSDASKTGWGSSCEDESVHGFWNEEERLRHINFLELLAAF